MRWRIEIAIAVFVRLVQVDEDRLPASHSAREWKIARAPVLAIRQRVRRAEGIAV